MSRGRTFCRSLIAVLCLALALAACGKKGPLYLPDRPRPAAPHDDAQQ